MIERILSELEYFIETGFETNIIIIAKSVAILIWAMLLITGIMIDSKTKEIFFSYLLFLMGGIVYGLIKILLYYL